MDTQEQFAAMLNQWFSDHSVKARPARGDMRDATIMAIHPDEILVDIGAKSTAVVPVRDLERLDADVRSRLTVGAEIPVSVVNSDPDGELVVSISMAQSMIDWRRAEGYLADGTIVETEITSYNKGGLLARFGRIQGFVPTSQVTALRTQTQGMQPTAAMQRLIGQKMPVKVIEVDYGRRRLVLSEVQARHEWEAEQREAFFAALAEGQKRRGVVTRVCDFGCFVNLGIMDGLVHISELSWQRVERPADLVKLGQEVDVVVLGVDKERERVSLSIKRMQDDPWIGVATRYHEGQLIEGEVSSLPKFGAFINLEPGLDGLVHVSELDGGHVESPKAVLSVGERLLARVMAVEPERHRIALSLRQVTAEDRERFYRPKEERVESMPALRERIPIAEPAQSGAWSISA